MRRSRNRKPASVTALIRLLDAADVDEVPGQDAAVAGHLLRRQPVAGQRDPSASGPGNHDGTAHNNLGTALFQLGRVKEAEPILRKALLMHNRISGDDDPETTRAMENLARVLARLGHRAEARAMAEDYLRIYSRNYPAQQEQFEKVRRLLTEL
jgi:tetratricopeptide (TPR) repeat protein